MSEYARLILNTDGACKGNPGPAAIGGVIVVDDGGDDPIPVEEISEYIGEATNNIAEYVAVIRTLERAAALGARDVELRTDSELLVKQVSGEYRVKNPGLQPLHAEVQRLRGGFASCAIVHVRREANRRADALANAAIKAHRRAGR